MLGWAGGRLRALGPALEMGSWADGVTRAGVARVSVVGRTAHGPPTLRASDRPRPSRVARAHNPTVAGSNPAPPIPRGAAPCVRSAREGPVASSMRAALSYQLRDVEKIHSTGPHSVRYWNPSVCFARRRA